MDTDWDPQGCAAIEALRFGVVNQYVARHITYGRDAEIAALESGVVCAPMGSCQVVIGGYGVGKTHLCEVLSSRLETAGYAVARIELGSSSERAENPDAVLASVCRSISLQMAGLRICGASDITCWVRAASVPPDTWGWESEFLRELHTLLPGEENILKRYDAIRERFTVEYQTDDFASLLIRRIPATMTACNLAVAEINELAHSLHAAGVRGLVLLLDEAERSNWATNAYRTERARDMMLGLGMAAANADTSRLRHYANDQRSPYVPMKPSRIHSIFWFTYAFGLAAEISRSAGVKALDLAPLGEHAMESILQKVTELYRSTYRSSTRGMSLEEFTSSARGDETRAMVRRLVAALDHARFHSHG